MIALWTRLRKMRNGVKFLAAVLAVYVLVGLFRSDLAAGAALRAGKDLLDLLPIFVVVYLAMAAADRFIRPETLRRYLGERSGWKGTALVLSFGLFLAGPPLVMYPLLGGFKKEGMGNGLIATFLYINNVKIVFLPVMVHYFGLEFTIVVAGLNVIFAIIAGALTSRLVGSTDAPVA